MIPRRFLSTVIAHSLLLFVSATAAQARVKLSQPVYGPHGIAARRGRPIWGWADDGELVTVEFRGRRFSATAKGGAWMVKLGKLKAGGPDVLKVTGKNSNHAPDVLVGEVWMPAASRTWSGRCAPRLKRRATSTRRTTRTCAFTPCRSSKRTSR